MSSTGPMTWTIRPVLRAAAVAVAIRTPYLTGFVPWAPTAFTALPAYRLPLQRRRSTHDLADLLRDRCLTLAVVRALQHLENLPGIVGGVLHCGAPGAVLRGGRLHEPAVHRITDVERQKLREDLVGAGLEDVIRPPPIRLLLRRRIHRQHPHRRGRRRDRAQKLRLDEIHARELAALVRLDERGDDLRRVLGRGPVTDVHALEREGTSQVAEEYNSLLADTVDLGLVALILEGSDASANFLAQL